MIDIWFENEFGKTEMGGGNNPLMRIISICGLGLPKKEINSVSYAYQDGVTVIGAKDMERTITIVGDIIGSSDEITRFTKGMYLRGTLYFNFGQKKRRINALCTSYEDLINQGANNHTAAVQFMCSDPYFNDFHDTVAPLYYCKNTVLDTFALPCIFTAKHISTDLIIPGDKNVYPVIKIEVGCSGIEYVSLKNETAGSFIRLNYAPYSGEKITIDLNNRKISNEKSENLLHYISNDTVLSSFFLSLGLNRIKVETDLPNSPLYTTVIYNPRYAEAVY